MRGTELEHELIVGAEIDLLEMLPLLQVPEMQAAAILGGEQNLRHQSVLKRVGRAPFAGHHGVVAEMPPGIVGETLRPAIDFPAAEHVEGLGVHQEHAARRFAACVAERRDIDAVRPAMDGMRAAIAGGLDHFFRLDDPHDGWDLRIGLGVDDVDARRAQARHHQVAPLGMRMRCIGAQTRAACVPAIVVQLVAHLWHIHAADDLRISGRGGIDVDHRDRVGHIAVGRKGRDIGERLGRRLGGEPRRGIERWVGRPSRHWPAPPGRGSFARRHGRNKSVSALRKAHHLVVEGHLVLMRPGKRVLVDHDRAAGEQRLLIRQPAFAGERREYVRQAVGE